MTRRYGRYGRKYNRTGGVAFAGDPKKDEHGCLEGEVWDPKQKRCILTVLDPDSDPLPSVAGGQKVAISTSRRGRRMRRPLRGLRRSR